MGKDFKTGLALGLILAIIGMVWVATRPSLGPKARVLRSAQAAMEETIAPSRALPPAEETAIPAPPTSHEQPPTGLDSVPPTAPAKPLVNAQSNQPDLTIYERAEKIKTTRFHIVRRDETLSAISRQYYGSPDRWRTILDANKDRIKDANRIQPGTKLTIPDLD